MTTDQRLRKALRSTYTLPKTIQNADLGLVSTFKQQQLHNHILNPSLMCTFKNVCLDLRRVETHLVFQRRGPKKKKKESIRRLYKQNYNFIHIVSQQPVLPLHQQHTLAASLQPGSLGTNNIDYFVKLV